MMFKSNIAHVDGMVRALLWVLTNEDPGPTPTVNTALVLLQAGIPYEVNKKTGMIDFCLPDFKEE